MANKQYISIIRLFNHCDISIGEDFSLSRAKKQLQAEFGITREGFIEVDGYSYTRHGVIEEIDQPDFLQRLSFHKQLWNCPQLLQLLEKNSADLKTIKDEFGPFWSNSDFDYFFSPYFTGPFSYIARTLLADARLKEMGDLFAYEDFLQPAEREEAFRPVRIFLEENIRLLRNINKDNYKMIRPKILHWIERDWYLFFNNLPAEFYETKNDIITLFINIGVAIQKTHKRDCRLISEQLMSLQETPENLRGIVVSNHTVYTGASSKSGSWSWGNMFWVVWIFFMIIRSVGSDGCGESNRNNYDFKPSQYQDYKIPDSLIQRLKKSDINIVADSIKK